MKCLSFPPFIDKTTLNTLQASTYKQPYLLSRKEEMDCMSKETIDGFHCWQFSKFIQEAEYIQELAEDGVVPSEQNLHAKLFVAMCEKVPFWYLGSANCSDPAQGRNVEFMVELKGSNVLGLKTKDIFNALTDPGKTEGLNLFTPYDYTARVSVEEQKKIELDIRKIKYDLTLLSLIGRVELIEGGTAYNLEIEIDAVNFNLPSGYKVKLKPLPELQKAPVVLKIKALNIINDFSGYPETALSPFLEFEIWKDDERYSSFLLPMQIELPASRLNRIFTSIIDSREKFLRYLTFLLTGEETDVIGNADHLPKKKDKDNGGDAWAFTGTPVYEKLLIAASRYPTKLKSIDLLIQRLKTEAAEFSEPIISPEFEGFWEIFKTFIDNKKK